jgi:hypothetical protein
LEIFALHDSYKKNTSTIVWIAWLRLLMTIWSWRMYFYIWWKRWTW